MFYTNEDVVSNDINNIKCLHRHCSAKDIVSMLQLKLMSDVVMGMKKCNLSELEYILVRLQLHKNKKYAFEN